MFHCEKCNRDYFKTPHVCGQRLPSTSYVKLEDRREAAVKQEMFTEAFELLLREGRIVEVSQKVYKLKQ